MTNATYKIILLGETDVGKSSFFVRYRDGRFVENLSGTVGLDETEKTITYMDNDQKIEVNVRLLFKFFGTQMFQKCDFITQSSEELNWGNSAS